MSKEKSDINWDLVAKHLAGETGATEEAQLRAWINGSEANRRFYADLEQWWRCVGQLTLYGKVDTAADWQIVKQRLRLYEPARRMTPLRRNIFRYSYPKAAAAVITALMIAGAAYYGLRHRGTEQSEAAYSRMFVPAGQQSQITLADGTSVWLNSDSRLHFPANFGSDCRMVELEGEAYFEVTAGKKPFTVRTPGVEVKVYGTSFHVTSYPDDDSDEVALLGGSVSVSGLGSGDEIALKPGQKISYLRDERLFTEPLQADRETETAWRDGKLVFDDVPFGKIAKKLERRYGVTIRIDDENIGQLRYRVTFRKESSLQQAIEAIQLTAGFRYKTEDNVVIIY